MNILKEKDFGFEQSNQVPPNQLILMRSAKSTYDQDRQRLLSSSEFQQFIVEFQRNRFSQKVHDLAHELQTEFDQLTKIDIPITEEGKIVGETTGKSLRELWLQEKIEKPNIIYVLPMLRARQTALALTKGWPEIVDVAVLDEDKIREYDRGTGTSFLDTRIYAALNPDKFNINQTLKGGPYRETISIGENDSDIRLRSRVWLSQLTQEHAGQTVMTITDVFPLLTIIAELEGLTQAEYLDFAENNRPINGRIIIYQRNQESLLLERTVYNADLTQQKIVTEVSNALSK